MQGYKREVKKLKSKVNIIEINVEENKELVKKYGVLGVPAFLIVEKGKVKKAFLGTKGLEYLKKGGK
ncbi:thioredoxin family protein [Aquifex aeolicus]|uniref:thioredoxin family protein n=1 Tax=Aquifex aeolicus TaxID=63363 RepID=UPI0013E8D2BC|nr:thioredoxin family protein [Aquifex aeolicus]